jgi:hypothetical protein
MERDELLQRTLLAVTEADRMGFTYTRDALFEIAENLQAQIPEVGPRLADFLDRRTVFLPEKPRDRWRGERLPKSTL